MSVLKPFWEKVLDLSIVTSVSVLRHASNAKDFNVILDTVFSSIAREKKDRVIEFL